jgi:Mrp family chromosome partitioning ATPase
MNYLNGTQPAVSLATNPASDIQAELLSVRIEVELSKPAVVMVTSARAGDGKSLAAHSLAASLEKCNHRVSLLEMPNEKGASHERLSAVVEEMRSNYDFTIIDAATFSGSRTVLSLARLVDGILVAVRIGRAPTAEDRSMVGILEQLGGNVVGVVATEAEAIANFERSRGESSASRFQPRRNGEQSPAKGLMAIVPERTSR